MLTMENIRFVATPVGVFTFILIIGVIFVNGMTDACNSISGIVSSEIWSLKKASFVCGVFNLVGTLLFSRISGRVALGVAELTDFGKYTSEAVCACLLGTILFSLICYLFSLPSSESHALLSCIGGAVAALSSRAFTVYVIITVISHTVISCVVSTAIAFIFTKLLKKYRGTCTKSDVFACILSSTMHGAQDGQKFIAMIMLLYMGNEVSGVYGIPFQISICVALTMMAGTMCGGRRMVDALGSKIVKTDKKIATSSDFSSSITILICSLSGLNASTGIIKACSSVGAGLSAGYKINTSTVKKLLFVSIITFPTCIGFGYVLTELFILLF